MFGTAVKFAGCVLACAALACAALACGACAPKPTTAYPFPVMLDPVTQEKPDVREQ